MDEEKQVMLKFFGEQDQTWWDNPVVATGNTIASDVYEWCGTEREVMQVLKKGFFFNFV